MPDARNYTAGPTLVPLWVPDVLTYRGGPQAGGPLYVPDVGNHRQGPQAREPSECLNGAELQRKTGQRHFLISSYKRLKKKRLWSGHNSCRRGSLCPCTLGAAKVPVGQAAAPPACSTLPGQSLQARKEKKKIKGLCVCTGAALVVSNALWSCRLWPARLLCQGDSPGKKTGVCWSILVAIPF